MTGLLFCGTVINYIDRVNISIVAPMMQQETGWSKVELGWIFSAFLIGNALLQFPGGVLADRWSARKVLVVAFIGFSLFTLLTPLGARSFALLLALRFLVGCFESVTFPAVIAINSRWFPRPEFGRAHTLSVSGVTVGQVVAYPLTTWIALTSSWQMVFVVNALLGLLWALLWFSHGRDTPAEHPHITAAERAHIEADLPPRPARPLALRALLASSVLLPFAVGFMCFGYVAALIIYWFPTYLGEARGFKLGEIAIAGVVMLSGAFVGLVGGGGVADALLRRGRSAQFARARFPGICILLSLPFLLATPLAPSGISSVACLVLGALLFNGGLAGYSTIAVELDPHQAGAVFGAMNMCAAFAAIFGPLTAGYVLGDGGNWVAPFAIASAVAGVSGLIMLVAPLRLIEPVAVRG
jgi:MFS transporter, ACS family, glucarate transporter